MKLHRAIDELCLLCEEDGRLSQSIEAIHASDNFENGEREELSIKESELHAKIHKCHNLRVLIEKECPVEIKTERD